MKGRNIAIILVLLALAGTALADYKADMVIKANGVSSTGKVFLKGDKARIEVPGSIVIKRPDKGVTYMLSPKSKTYMEFPDKQTRRKIALYESMPGVKRLGTETVNGYPCNKYQISTQGRAPSTATIWVSDKLNIELKVVSQSPGRSMTMDIQNVKRTFLFGKTFEIPKDYTKAPMPARVPMRR